MKKSVFALATIGIAVCCLGACKTKDVDEQYNELNAMLQANYSEIVIRMTDTFDKDTSLTEEYRMSYSSTTVFVEYSVERFVEISIDNPSSDLKTELKGIATIKDGSISFNGDEVPGMTADIANISLNFNKSYFAKAEFEDKSFTADVSSPSGFMGSALLCTNMKVNAAFDEVFSSIQISYTSPSGSQVKYSYTFTA